MATKLWAKGYDLDPRIEHYGAARNADMDARIARHDCWGSLAHARMLRRVGLLTDADWVAIDTGLKAILAEVEAGSFAPAPEEEDIHTAVEGRLVALCGDAGKMLHTGRSRNDQVLLDLRLFAREALIATAQTLLATAEAMLDLAIRHEWTPMPGYTHMQRAMLSSVGLWASAHAEALLDDLGPLTTAYAFNDQSPLGSGAAFGVPLPLDRPYVAELLGFATVHHNVLTAANARGKGEALVIQALALVMLDLSKFAQDVLLATTQEFAFMRAPAILTDGSSMMPQKRNLSALELVRARAQTVIALQGQVLATLAGLPSGYNMDYQETKGPLIAALDTTPESLEVAALFAQGLEIDVDRLRAACTPDLFATDRAYDLARAGVPFRDAYRQVAANPSAEAPGDLVVRLQARDVVGGPGRLELATVTARITAARATWEARAAHITRALSWLTARNPTMEGTVPAEPLAYSDTQQTEEL